MIICGFPGIGKSYATAYINSRRVLDLESSIFKKDDGWYVYYVNEIEKNLNYNFYDYILVSTHEEVRKELQKRNIPYLIVAPNSHLRDDYLRRYFQRDDPIEYIKKLNDNWFVYLMSLADDPMPMIKLETGEGLLDILVHPEEEFTS